MGSNSRRRQHIKELLALQQLGASHADATAAWAASGGDLAPGPATDCVCCFGRAWGFFSKAA